MKACLGYPMYSRMWMERELLVTLSSLSLCHIRLGHVHYKKIKKMVTSELLPNFGGEEPDKCEVCLQAKVCEEAFQGCT